MRSLAIVCLASALVAVPVVAQSKESSASFPISVDAIGIQRSGGHFYLDMLVWNCSNKALTMDITNLPWGGWLTKGLVIYHAFSGKTLQPVFPVEDFPETPYVIPAGGSVTGQIALNSYFPDLAKVKDGRDFVVFWVYQPRGEKGAPVGKKFGGMVPLDTTSSTSSGKNSCPAGT